MGIIYKIENKINHKIYIGQTRFTLERRIKEHFKTYKNLHIDNALRKYGLDNFDISILEDVDNSRLSEREIYLLALTEMNLEELKEFGDEIVMKEYINEAEKESFEGGFGEAYDKEWALKDEGIREGSMNKTIEIAKALLNNKVDIDIISKSTGLSIEEINSLQ